jgi:hypothetical protein
MKTMDSGAGEPANNGAERLTGPAGRDRGRRPPHPHGQSAERRLRHLHHLVSSGHGTALA